MIKKFPAKIVGYSKKYKFTKLPPEKVKRKFDTTTRASKIADQNIRDTLGPDPLEFGTVTHQHGSILRRESVARRLTERKFIRDLPDELKKGRIVIARKLKSFDPITKSTYKPIKSPTHPKFYNYPKKFKTSIDLKKAKSTSAFKRYKSVEKTSDKIFTDITEKRSPFKHQTTDIKFITSKRFRKGRSDKSMLPDKQYSKMERGAYGQKRRMAEFASQATNLTKQGKVNWNKFWKTEGPRQKGYIKYRRKQLKDWRKPPKKI